MRSKKDFHKVVATEMGKRDLEEVGLSWFSNRLEDKGMKIKFHLQGLTDPDSPLTYSYHPFSCSVCPATSASALTVPSAWDAYSRQPTASSPHILQVSAQMISYQKGCPEPSP